MTDDKIKDLLQRKSVLTFEAFRITQYGFEFISVDNEDLNVIEGLTTKEFRDQFQEGFESNLSGKVEEVKDKIKSSPNYLLILQNVLNRNWKNLKEVAFATNKIIYI